MKILIHSLLVLMLLINTQSSYAFDAFFRGNNKQFIKIDRIQLGNEMRVHLTACEVLNDSQNQASCSPIASTEESDFEKMRQCAVTTGTAAQVGGVVSGAISGWALWTGLAAGVISGPIGFIIIVGATGAVAGLKGGDQHKETVAKTFSDVTKNDIDQGLGSINFDTFVETVKKSIDSNFCRSHSTRIESGKFLYSLTEDQVRWLNAMKK